MGSGAGRGHPDCTVSVCTVGSDVWQAARNKQATPSRSPSKPDGTRSGSGPHYVCILVAWTGSFGWPHGGLVGAPFSQPAEWFQATLQELWPPEAWVCPLGGQLDAANVLLVLQWLGTGPSFAPLAVVGQETARTAHKDTENSCNGWTCDSPEPKLALRLPFRALSGQLTPLERNLIPGP